MTRMEWVVLIPASLWALLTNITVRERYKTTVTPSLGANMQAMLQTFSVLAVLVFHKSPLHLLWLFPSTYIAGVIFNPYKSKIFGFLPWLYGYLLSYTIPSNW
jgi:hypothetical protein